MVKTEKKSCCFFGHRKIEVTEKLVKTLFKYIEKLIIQEDVNTFFFGSKSEFNGLCYQVVTVLKEKYPHIRRIYVRAVFPHISDDYKAYLLEGYEDTYFPDDIEKAGRAAYVERNYKMIDQSKFCIVYYDENYVLPKQRQGRRNMCYYQPKSGTKIAYEYAVKKGKDVFNLFF